MPHDDANKAIAKLDGVSFIGRNLKISEANERA
jgi:RNA recognition motif-containing protein